MIAVLILAVLNASAAPPSKTGATNVQRKPACRPQASDADTKDVNTRAQYPLNRVARDVSIQPLPLVRTRCWIRDTNSGETKLVEFDPSTELPTVRRIYFRKSRNAAAPTLSLTCAAELRTLECGKDCKGQVTYNFVESTLTSTGTVLVVPAGAVPNVPVIVKVTDPKMPCGPTILDFESSDGRALAHPRSLDALTPLINDLLTTVAQVAIEHAKAAVVQEIRVFLTENVCDNLKYENQFGGKNGRLTFGQILFINTSTPTPTGTILPSTCEAIRSVRIEDLAAGAGTLERALGADLLGLCGKLLTAFVRHPQLVDTILTGMNLVISLLEGRSVSSERDVQLLLLKVGSLEVFNPKAYAWKAPLSLSFAIMAECIRDGECTADRLKRALEQELQNPSPEWGPVLTDAIKNWPELPAIIARAIDVLQPPTGTTARMTVKASLNIVFDVLEHVVRKPEKMAIKTRGRYEFVTFAQRKQKIVELDATASGPAFQTYFDDLPKNAVSAARTLANAAIDRDLGNGLVAAFALIGNAIAAYCKTQGDICKVPLTNAQVQKTFGLLNAFATYAATYREPNPTQDDDPTAATELERTRLEQRKRAMEQLIETFADRSNRLTGEVIVSAGVGVGFAISWTKKNVGSGFNTDVIPGLSLPLGLGLEVTGRPVGFYLHAALLDVAQYATVDTQGNIADPNPATAVFFGGTAALRFGSPNLPILVGITGGYAPGLRLMEDQKKGTTRIGFFAGTYVPFLDFN
jgi:hypothetical protein